MRMSSLQWEWKIGPQTIVAAVNLLVMSAGIIGIFVRLEADVQVAQQDVRLSKEQVLELRSSVNAVAEAQNRQAVDAAGVKAKVDLMLPMIEKIGDQLRLSHP
jgi:hypothetical protein